MNYLGKRRYHASFKTRTPGIISDKEYHTKLVSLLMNYLGKRRYHARTKPD